jgi:hypothetical protein
MLKHVWTADDFDQMSWHDNHVHGVRFLSGQDGAGELVFDIDYILEWLKDDQSKFKFRVQAATLVFHDVMFPRIAVDYASATAAFGPFMISGIERRIEKRERYEAQIWRLPITWPGGQIEFEARGFTQRADGQPVVTSNQVLRAQERRRAPE